jgi:predicted nuclease of predicted toxin-antitoxin system
MSKIKFYLDENLSVEIAEQLNRNGIDAITVRDIGKLGDDDQSHLERATSMGRVLCT